MKLAIEIIFILILIKIIFPALFMLIAAVSIIVGLMALMGGK